MQTIDKRQYSEKDRFIAQAEGLCFFFDCEILLITCNELETSIDEYVAKHHSKNLLTEKIELKLSLKNALCKKSNFT
jgi:hypothetical protein